MPSAREVFYASQLCSIEDFLKTDISMGSHIYCAFKLESMDQYLLKRLKLRAIKSISFSDGYTLYPSVGRK